MAWEDFYDTVNIHRRLWSRMHSILSYFMRKT